MTYVLLNSWSIQIIYSDSFIASQQALALAVDGNGRPVISRVDDAFLSVVANLADDTIEGVRIGVARFAAAVHSKSCAFWLSIVIIKSLYREITDNLVRQSHAIPSVITDLVHRLSQDSSHEVQSYIMDLTPRRRSVTESDNSPTIARYSRKRLTQLSTFSRPPQPHISYQPLGDAILVGGRSFSADSAGSGRGLRSLHTHDGNAFLISEDISHADGLPPSSFCVNGVYNRDERFGNARERVTVPG